MLIFLILFSTSSFAALNVPELIHRSEQQSLGNNLHARLRMTVASGADKRELEILSWTEGKDKALVKILGPAKDRGTGNLRLEANLWQYLPKVERTIKVPPSLMLQSWMGSDFTNDDLVKASRLSRDYECKHDGDEKVEGVATAKLICMPKPDAPVVWGKLVLWIDPKTAVLVKQDFFTENGDMIKEMKGSAVKTFGGHTIASKLTMVSLKKNTTTTLEYLDAKYDQAIDKKVFNQAYLQAPLKDE